MIARTPVTGGVRAAVWSSFSGTDERSFGLKLFPTTCVIEQCRRGVRGVLVPLISYRYWQRKWMKKTLRTECVSREPPRHVPPSQWRACNGGPSLDQASLAQSRNPCLPPEVYLTGGLGRSCRKKQGWNISFDVSRLRWILSVPHTSLSYGMQVGDPTDPNTPRMVTGEARQK